MSLLITARFAEPRSRNATRQDRLEIVRAAGTLKASLFF